MKSQGRKGADKGAKAFVGMSGGVDSSVSAALLVRAGYDVVGVFIQVWQPDWIECNWKEERLEAMRAAAHLGIPFVTLNLEKEYKEGVIDYMISEYRAGRTPNPDVMCNREVKFGAFWKWAQSKGADFIATGHYARNENSRLLISKDTDKDQSYFLWTLKKEDLEHVLFPVGTMTKPEVRKLAKRFRLPNADKKDSQGLCFIGKVDVKAFLSHYIKTEKGDVLNESEKVIGHHPGALLFTIGERHGFTITKKTPNDAAYFVVSKNVELNTLIVSNKPGGKMGGGHAPASLPQIDQNLVDLKKPAKGTLLYKVSWVNEPPTIGEALQARTRYRQPLEDVEITVVGAAEAVDTATVSFSAYQNTITPGQSLVIYRGAECLGGGIIE